MSRKKSRKRNRAEGLENENQQIAFLISSCSNDKIFGLQKLDEKTSQQLTTSLHNLEKNTWKDLSTDKDVDLQPVEYGTAYQKIHQCNKHKSDTIGAEDDRTSCYYFRVSKQYRVFGYKHEQFFYITHLDPHHKFYNIGG